MLKRIFDIIVALVGMICLSPIFLIVAVLIKVRTPGPALFVQKRSGRFGRPFNIYKFRTMIVSQTGNTVTVLGESRITPLGAKLRKHKIDELPELWNIFIGDMSFVGPRPDMPEYSNRLVGEEKLILELRPGITGPASLKYANEEELLANVSDPLKFSDEVLWPDKIKLNLEYYRNHNFCNDLSIIIKTIIKRPY
jgi:lipopolysaccharide/colanic/teichoic acid biosynthesis glycosyltransferase